MRKIALGKYIPHLSIDCVVFGYENKALKVLVSKFKYGKDLWGLPGGYILKTESVNDAARRVLKGKTGLDNVYLEQFKVFGDANRIHGSEHRNLLRNELRKYDIEIYTNDTIKWILSRFISIGYYALVDIAKVATTPGDIEECLEWRNVRSLPELTFDHKDIVAAGLEALCQNLDQKLIGFNLLPPTFTMKEIQELYEAVYNKPFARNNFHKKMIDLDVLERLEKKFTGAANKAPYLYRFKR